MALPSSYKVGTVSVSANSAVVTGVGTNWTGAGLREGDIFAARGLSVSIATVDSATQITLAEPWQGAALSGQPYEVRFTSDAGRVLGSLNSAISLFGDVRNPPFIPFSSLYSAESTRIPADIPSIRVGGKTYVRDAAGKALTTADGARWMRDQGIPVADVMDFGGSARLNPDGGETDNTAIIDAIAWLRQRGGGGLYIPGGNYLVGDTSPHLFNLQNDANIHVFGDGPGATRITHAGQSSTSIFYLRDVERVSVRGMSLDWSDTDGQHSGHCIRIDGKEVWCRDLDLSGGMYNLAIGQSTYVEGLYLSDITMSDSISDALDCKNRQNKNRALFASGLFVKSFGVDPNGLQDENSVKAGLDFRGKWQVENVRVEGVTGDDAGIRFRPGEVGQENGAGGHGSQLSNFAIVAENSAGATSVGLSVQARDVRCLNGSIFGSRRGAVIASDRFVGTAIDVEGATEYGLQTIEATNNGVAAKFIGCNARECGINGFRLEADDGVLLGCGQSGNGGAGVRVQSTANRTVIVANVARDNAGDPISDAGTNTSIIADIGGTIGNFINGELRVNGTRLLGARKTGWTVPVGTPQRTGYTVYEAPTASATYSQAQQQTMMNAVQDVSRTLKALMNDLHSSTAGVGNHGLFGS